MQLYNDSGIIKCKTDIGNRKLTYFIETYGCQMNVRDSETYAGIFHRIGISESTDKNSADIILFVTCCVREHAEKKLMGNIGALKKLKDDHKDLIIGICGCMMQEKGIAEKLYRRFPYVDFFMGTYAVPDFAEILHRAFCNERTIFIDEEPSVTEGLPAFRQRGTSAFVNITYGCDNYCTYCIVPYVRGHERSRAPEDIINEIKELIANGYTEITLLGQNVNSYSSSEEDPVRFPELLRRIDSLPGLKRLRFMTSHPKDLNDDLIDTISQSKTVCHHIHLPVQSGSDRILKKMNRKYTVDAYLQLVRKLRERIPDIELTTDIIVGFPGETDIDFKETVKLVETVGYAAAFTFKYSPRIGTVAAKSPDQISEQIKKERLECLNRVQYAQTTLNNEKYKDYTGEVLIEGFDEKNPGIVFGKFGNFKMIYFAGLPEEIGTYVNVRCTEIRNRSLYGERV